MITRDLAGAARRSRPSPRRGGAGDREGVDEVAVARADVAHVARAIRLLGVQLHDDRAAARAAARGPAAGRRPAASS